MRRDLDEDEALLEDDLDARSMCEDLEPKDMYSEDDLAFADEDPVATTEQEEATPPHMEEQQVQPSQTDHPRKAGRPAGSTKADSRKQKNRVVVLLTDSEKDRLDRVCEAEGETAGGYIRSVLHADWKRRSHKKAE